jgi:hypothetical protein
MDIARFEDLVDRHGEDLAQWPSAVRNEAEAFATATPAARECLRRARALRAAFAAAPPVRAPRDLSARIMASLEETDPPAAVAEQTRIRLPGTTPEAAAFDRYLGPAQDFLRRPLRSLMAATIVFALGLTSGIAWVEKTGAQVAAEDTLLFRPILR